jgi:hypothetical protein
MSEAIAPGPSESTDIDNNALRDAQGAGRIDDVERARYAAARAKHTIDAAVEHRVDAARLADTSDTIGQMDKEYHEREGSRLAERADEIVEDASSEYARLTEKQERGLIDDAIEDEKRRGNLQ